MTTHKGDLGLTDSIARKDIRKDDKSIIALAHLDRLSAELGLARAQNPALSAQLEGIQLALVELMGIISGSGKKFDGKYLAFLDSQITELKAVSVPFKHFILPGSNTKEAVLHLARTSARLAETACVAASTPQAALAFINRLSLYLFMLALEQAEKQS